MTLPDRSETKPDAPAFALLYEEVAPDLRSLDIEFERRCWQPMYPDDYHGGLVGPGRLTEPAMDGPCTIEGHTEFILIRLASPTQEDGSTDG